MWGLIPFLYLSVWCGFGQKVYKFIADRRIIIPSGGCNMLTGCQVKLTRQKEHMD
ncbi:hypothetical protein ACT7C9_32015 [Bacillus cereus]